MKYGYIPIDPIIAEVQAQFSTINKMGKLSDDDCYNYAVQALRKIGVHNYDPVEQWLTLKNHRCAIPKDFYLFEDVRLCSRYTGTNSRSILSRFIDNFWWEPATRALRPVDVLTLDYCSQEFQKTPTYDRFSYSFKSPPNILACDLRDGVIYVKYQALKKDEQGNYMVQDEENCVDFMKHYILVQSLKEGYVLGKVAKYIYDDLKRDMDNSLNLAQNSLLAGGPDEINTLVEDQRRRLNQFNLK